MTPHPLADYQASSGRLEPVWTVEIETISEEVNSILDAVLEVHPLSYGRYERNASVSAVGAETARPQANSTTAQHVGEFEPGATETFPMVTVKISIERDVTTLAAVMDAILDAHHYEQPVIFVSDSWASRSAYDPNNKNPNRWWNNGRGLPERIKI